jgi:Ca2+/H+ antiporter, TMEM165/GDT1 family
MDLAVALTALVLIVPVELPDKTFVATLVLATRYRPLLVWIGVGAAFLVQTVVAVTAGGLLARLPHRPVVAFAALMFLVGGIVLLRHARRVDDEEAATEAEFDAKVDERVGAGTGGSATGLRAVAASFTVLFLAEWGDLSQLLTAGLVVRTKDPVSVFAGAWLGLLLVSALGAVAGRALLRHVRLATVQRIGGGVCLLLAVLSGLQAIGLDLPV